jgi:hypothetical protein
LQLRSFWRTLRTLLIRVLVPNLISVILLVTLEQWDWPHPLSCTIMKCYPCYLDYEQHQEQERYLQLAIAQTHQARLEIWCLKKLYTNVCWYNFEVNASRWGPPWHPTDQATYVRLNVSKPWYEGPVGHAPPLPPVIVGTEITDSVAKHACAEQVEWDAIDFAPPHGKKYLELCRTTKVPTSLMY